MLHGIYEGKYGLLPEEEESKSNGKQRAESESGSEGEDDDEGDDEAMMRMRTCERLCKQAGEWKVICE